MYSMNVKKKKMVGLYTAQSSQAGKNCQELTSHKNKKYTFFKIFNTPSNEIP